MKVVIKNIDEKPFVTEIENNLSAYQEIVDGYIQTLPLDENVLLICNEEGIIKGLPLNFGFYKDYQEFMIFGNVFFVRVSEDEFTDLTDRDIERIMKFLEV